LRTEFYSQRLESRINRLEAPITDLEPPNSELEICIAKNAAAFRSDGFAI